jgi:hypothetical protein
MNPKLPLLLAFQVGIGSLALGAEIPKPSDEVVMMKPYVVEERSLAKAGFGFKATFRHHRVREEVGERENSANHPGQGL